jgi:PAS domain S-box-containing protein
VTNRDVKMQKGYDTFLDELKNLNGKQTDLATIIEEWEPVLKNKEWTHDILESVFDNIDYAVLVVDAETRTFLHCNPATKDLFGYTPEEIIGRSTRLIHVDQSHYDRYGRESEPVLDRGESFHSEYPLLKKDGTRFQAEITTTPIQSDGTWLEGVMSIVKDVTAEKKKEEHRRRNIDRLRLMTEQVPTILWTTDRDLTIDSLLGSEAYKLRPDKDPLLNRRVYDIFQSAEDHHVVKSHESALSGERSSYEILYQEHVFRAYVEPLIEENEDIVGVIGVAYDVTEEKNLEEQHAERVKELECLSKLSELNIYHRYDVDGFIREAVRIVPDAFHYPDATSVRIRLQENEFVSEGFAEKGALREKEVVVYDTRYGKIQVFVDPEKIPQREPEFLEDEKRLLDIIAERIGRMLERKIENDSLSKKTKHLQAVIDSARDSIALLNDRAEYVDVNPENQRITGYSKQELLGTPVSDLLVGEMKEIFDSAWKELMDKGTLSGEAELERKDGRIITFEFHAVANILPGIHLSINRDITERKAYEEQLERNLREREVLLQEIHHRVKNNLQVIISMLNLQRGRYEDSTAQSGLEDAIGRIQTIALVYERIHAAESLEIVDMKDYLEGLLSGLNAEADKKVILSWGIEPFEFDINSAVSTGLIANELVTNCLKHAFPSERRGTVHITLERDDAKTAELIVRDDGTGFPEEFDLSRPATLGLGLVGSLVQQLEGDLELFNDGGAVARIRFPLPQSPGH